MSTAKASGAGPAESAHSRENQGDPESQLARTEELSALVNHLQTSIEAERSALAKDLHDELGGLITAAKMDMAWLTAHLGSALDPAGEEKFRSVVQMLNQAMVLKRRVVENLRPSLLDHFGLPVALRSHFDENCGRAGLEYIATLPEETVDLDPATQLALFRIAQEALAGVLRRGGAKNVELLVEGEAGGYSMLIGDNGPDMDPKLSQALIGMRYRIEVAGGTLEAETVPGQGNRIRVFVPRSQAESG